MNCLQLSISPMDTTEFNGLTDSFYLQCQNFTRKKPQSGYRKIQHSEKALLVAPTRGQLWHFFHSLLSLYFFFSLLGRLLVKSFFVFSFPLSITMSIKRRFFFQIEIIG